MLRGSGDGVDPSLAEGREVDAVIHPHGRPPPCSEQASGRESVPVGHRRHRGGVTAVECHRAGHAQPDRPEVLPGARFVEQRVAHAFDRGEDRLGAVGDIAILVEGGQQVAAQIRHRDGAVRWSRCPRRGRSRPRPADAAARTRPQSKVPGLPAPPGRPTSISATRWATTLRPRPTRSVSAGCVMPCSERTASRTAASLVNRSLGTASPSGHMLLLTVLDAFRLDSRKEALAWRCSEEASEPDRTDEAGGVDGSTWLVHPGHRPEDLPVGDAASAISRFIQALATSTSTVFVPGRRAAVTSICHGAVQTIPQSIAVDPDPSEVADVAELRGRRSVRRLGSSSTSVAYVPDPGEAGRVGPRSVHGRGPSGSSVSRTPGRDSRHAPSRGSPPPPGRGSSTGPPGTTNTDPSGGSSIRPSPDRRPPQGHRVPGDQAPGRPQRHRRRLRRRVGQEDHLAAPIRRPIRSTSAPSTTSARPQPSPSSAAARSRCRRHRRRSTAGRRAGRARRRRRPATASRPDAGPPRSRPRSTSSASAAQRPHGHPRAAAAEVQQPVPRLPRRPGRRRPTRSRARGRPGRRSRSRSRPAPLRSGSVTEQRR